MKEKKFSLSESAIRIADYLEVNGQKTQKQVIQEMSLSVRTVRYGVRRLKENGLVRSIPNMMDLRSVYYERTELLIPDDVRVLK